MLGLSSLFRGLSQPGIEQEYSYVASPSYGFGGEEYEAACEVDSDFASAFQELVEDAGECSDAEYCPSLLTAYTLLSEATLEKPKGRDENVTSYFDFDVFKTCTTFDLLSAANSDADFEELCVEADDLGFVFNGSHCLETLDDASIEDLLKTFQIQDCPFSVEQCELKFSEFAKSRGCSGRQLSIIEEPRMLGGNHSLSNETEPCNGTDGNSSSHKHKNNHHGHNSHGGKNNNRGNSHRKLGGNHSLSNETEPCNGTDGNSSYGNSSSHKHKNNHHGHSSHGGKNNNRGNSHRKLGGNHSLANETEPCNGTDGNSSSHKNKHKNNHGHKGGNKGRKLQFFEWIDVGGGDSQGGNQNEQGASASNEPQQSNNLWDSTQQQGGSFNWGQPKEENITCDIDVEFAEALQGLVEEAMECSDTETCAALFESLKLTEAASKGYFDFEVARACNSLNVILAAQGSDAEPEDVVEELCVDTDDLGFVFQGKHCLQPLSEVTVAGLLKSFGSDACPFEAAVCVSKFSELNSC